MNSIEIVLRHFANEDNTKMYQHIVAVREYLQYIADDRVMLFETIDRLAVNNLAAHDNR